MSAIVQFILGAVVTALMLFPVLILSDAFKLALARRGFRPAQRIAVFLSPTVVDGNGNGDPITTLPA